MKKKLFILTVIIALSLTACNKKKDKTNIQHHKSTPEESTYSSANMENAENPEFTETLNYMKDEFSNQELYPDILSFQISLYGTRLIIHVGVGDSLTKEEGIDIAEKILNRFSSVTAMNNQEYKKSTPDEFGTVFNSLDTRIRVSQPATTENPREWLVDVNMPFTNSKDPLLK